MDTENAVARFGLSAGHSLVRILRTLARAGYHRETPVPSRYECIFLETQDGRLAKEGCRLALRRTGQGLTLHFEGREGDHEEPFGGDLSLLSLPSDTEGFPPTVKELVSGRLLFPLVRLKVVAQTVRLQSPSGSRLSLRAERSVAAAPWDDLPKGPWPLGVLSIRFLEGNPDALLHLATYARDRLGLPPGSGDLCRTALQALGLPEPGAPVPLALRICPADPMALAGRKVVGQQVLKIRANVRGTLQDLDPEYLHDLRVATRRLRSGLRLFAAVLGPKRSESLRVELSWIAGLLGAVRDRDVFISNLEAQSQRLAEAGGIAGLLAEELHRQRGPMREALESALTSRRFASLIHRLEVLASSPLPRRDRSATVAQAAPVLLQKAQKRVRRLGRTITPNSPATDLHRLRILFKRLRYACEFFREAFADPSAGQDPLADYIEAMVRFQDCLGDHQDAVVASGRIQTLAKDLVQRGALSSDQLLNLGGLIQVQREIATDRRGRLLKLWRKFDKPAVRKFLAALEVSSPPAPGTGALPQGPGHSGVG
jgi:CHAD domain-containing protein